MGPVAMNEHDRPRAIKKNQDSAGDTPGIIHAFTSERFHEP
jgi:hypothetical protein